MTYVSTRTRKKYIFDVRKHFKPTDTFQYTQFSSCHPQERLYERRSLRLLLTNSSKATFEENITLFKQRLRNRSYPDKRLDKTLSEVNFSERFVGPTKQKTRKNISLFVTEYRPSVSNLNAILMSKWHLIENQPLREEIYKDPPLLSY